MLKSVFIKIGVALLVIALVDLIYINYWVLQSSKKVVSGEVGENNRKIEAIPSPSPEVLASPTPATVTSTQKSVGGGEAVPAPIVQTQIQQKTVVQTAQKEIFIPIGSGTTFSNTYADLAGVEVTIDASKYSGIESVVFEGSIWVQDGNGKMYTQLYNKTDGRPVWNSEISTSSPTAVAATSPKITLENGSRTYIVQAKTNLTEYAAHVENAKIKITLK